MNSQFCTALKGGGKTWASSAIFRQVLKVINRPIGKNSPNLVALVLATLKSVYFS
jgi:hypothetical protein